jgi:glycosyltransferase involved in cell wall biosynthesis
VTRAAHLVVDARTIRAGASGVGHFSAGILAGLDELAGEGVPPRVTALVPAGPHDAWSRGALGRLRGVAVEEVAPDYQRHPAGDWWLNAGLPRLVERLGGTTLLSPAYLAPVVPCRFRRIVVIHDAIAWTHPENYPAGFRWYIRTMARLAARACDVVATVSPSEAHLLRRLGLAGREGIAVVPNGVDQRVFRPGAEARVREVLCVSSPEPRKNLGMLLRAVGGMTAPAPVRVVGVRDPRARARLREVAGNVEVVFEDLVEEGALALLYRRAGVVAFPSRREGFGLPVLEAMASGAPLVASDIAAVRWLTAGGRCARLVPPDDVGAWSGALEAALGSADQEMARFARRARSRSLRFTWRLAAGRLALLAGGPPS